MNLHQYQRSRSFFDLRPKVSQFSKLNPFFSKTIDLFETKYHVKDFGNTEIIIYMNGLGHMTKTAATPIYGKNPSKIFFSRTRGLIAMKLVM